MKKWRKDWQRDTLSETENAYIEGGKNKAKTEDKNTKYSGEWSCFAITMSLRVILVVLFRSKDRKCLWLQLSLQVNSCVYEFDVTGTNKKIFVFPCQHKKHSEAYSCKERNLKKKTPWIWVSKLTLYFGLVCLFNGISNFVGYLRPSNSCRIGWILFNPLLVRFGGSFLFQGASVRKWTDYHNGNLTSLTPMLPSWPLATMLRRFSRFFGPNSM